MFIFTHLCWFIVRLWFHVFRAHLLTYLSWVSALLLFRLFRAHHLTLKFTLKLFSGEIPAASLVLRFSIVLWIIHSLLIIRNCVVIVEQLHWSRIQRQELRCPGWNSYVDANLSNREGHPQSASSCRACAWRRHYSSSFWYLQVGRSKF